MEVRIIYDPLLRAKAEPVSVFDVTLKEEADEMLATMKSHNGIGLAGNQVGLNKRIIVLGYEPADEDDELPTVPFQQLCNPRVIKFSKEKDIVDEGCLSLPGLELPVERSVGVTVEAQDLTGKKITIKAKGLHARILQHEVDHLNGILFTDHVKNYKKIDSYKFAKIVFLGSDDFSRPVLGAIVESGLNVMAVITETAKRAGRGNELAEPLIKTYAYERGIAVIQPEDKDELTYVIEQLKPDLLVLASYGKILPGKALDVPTYGSLNVHPSLLPKHRGATPIQSAILAGDTETGVTIMEMAAQVDAGGIVAQQHMPIEPANTTATLKSRLAKLGGGLLVKTIPIFLAGQAQIRAQDNSEATQTKKLSKEMGEIDWNLPIEQIDRQIRALNPWPGTFTRLAGKRLKILEVELTGTKLNFKKVQLEGKNSTDWEDFKRGYANQLTKESWFSTII